MNNLNRSLTLLSLLSSSLLAGPIQLSLNSFSQTQGFGLVSGVLAPGGAVQALCIDRFLETEVPSTQTGNLAQLDLGTVLGRQLAFIYLALTSTMVDVQVINYNPNVPLNPIGVVLFQYVAWEAANPLTETYFANNLGANNISSDSLTLFNAVSARVTLMTSAQFVSAYGQRATGLKIFTPDDKSGQRFIVNPVPEPGTYLSAGVGLLLCICGLRRRLSVPEPMPEPEPMPV